jgi:hypothetical protein
MTTGDNREEIMKRDIFMVAIASLALLNGQAFSPVFDLVFIFMRPFAAAFYITSPVLLFYFTSLFLSIMTLMLSGVAAAAFERMTSRSASDATSLGVWLAACIVLVLPALFGAALNR